MTGEQKAWLDAHRGEYEALGVVGGTTRYKDRGTLSTDGIFTPGRPPTMRETEATGAIGVGKLVTWEKGRPLDTRPARGGA